MKFARIGYCVNVIDFALGQSLRQDRLPGGLALLLAVEICLQRSSLISYSKMTMLPQFFNIELNFKFFK